MKLHWYWIVFSCLVTAATSIGVTFNYVIPQKQSDVDLERGCEMENRDVSRSISQDVSLDASGIVSPNSTDTTGNKNDVLPKIPVEIDAVDERKSFANIADDERVTNLTKKIHSDLSIGVKHYQDSISQDYDSEPQDVYWSREQVSYLSHLLKQHNALSQLNQYGLECKTTLCRISFPPTSPQVDRVYMEAISAALTQQAEPVIFHYLPSSTGGDNVVYARVTRD